MRHITNQQNYTKNITNKIYDSLYLGLPIITSLHGETEKLINSTNTGKIYDQGSVNSLCDAIKFFYLDKNKLKITKITVRNSILVNLLMRKIYEPFAKYIMTEILK